MNQSVSTHFPSLTIDRTDPAARVHLEEAQARFGFVPLPLARHAHAPALVEAFAELHELFEKTSLTPMEREATTLAIVRVFDCGLCRTMHAGLLAKTGASSEIVSAIQEGGAVPEPRLAALVRFVEATVRTYGAVNDDELDAFVAAGYTPRQALEIVVGIATYTLTAFANRMTRSHTMR